MPAERGQTAVVVPVPNAEPVVSAWRERFDDSAGLGMPAHITVLYPFLSEQRLRDGALHALRDLCAESPTLDVQFARTGRFADVLYLAPEPASGSAGSDYCTRGALAGGATVRRPLRGNRPAPDRCPC